MNKELTLYSLPGKVLIFNYVPLDVAVIQEPKQIERLLEEKSLDRIKDIVQEKLEIPPTLIKSDRWTAKKKEFLLRVKKHLSTNPFKVPMDRDGFDRLLEERADLDRALESVIGEKRELESLVDELKKAKDKSEVTAILKRKKPSTQFQEFQELCGVVKRQLQRNSRILNGMIFKTYSGKDITIKWEGNKEEIDEAFANDFIDEGLSVKWGTTTEMSSIGKALDDVAEFLRKEDLNQDFYQSYEEHFNAPMQLNNKKFWEEVFEASISFY